MTARRSPAPTPARDPPKGAASARARRPQSGRCPSYPPLEAGQSHEFIPAEIMSIHRDLAVRRHQRHGRRPGLVQGIENGRPAKAAGWLAGLNRRCHAPVREPVEVRGEGHSLVPGEARHAQRLPTTTIGIVRLTCARRVGERVDRRRARPAILPHCCRTCGHAPASSMRTTKSLTHTTAPSTPGRASTSSTAAS